MNIERLTLMILFLMTYDGQQPGAAGVPQSAVPEPAQTSDLDPHTLVRFLGFELIVGFLLFALFLVGSLLMIRTMRRLRRIFLRSPPTPTQSEDVWMMHKLPPDTLDVDPTEGYS